MFSDSLKKAVSLGLAKRRPFALYALPDEQEMYFVASTGETCLTGTGNGFYINAFNNAYGSPIFIPDELSIDDAIRDFEQSSIGNEPDIKPCRFSTDKSTYIERTSKVISDLKRDGGKTVLSRVICGEFGDSDIMEVAESYFGAFSSTFRYIYYTPMTGAWMGASPEVLIKRESGSGVISTMALAGTRRRSRGDWDTKNLEEHRFVTDYILSVLRKSGLEPVVGPDENVAFGAIEHLCHKIMAKYTGDLIDVASLLSPTPALAGFPLEQALKHIDYAELHPRNCYGGYVGCRNDRGEFLYVNLRCMHFDDKSYCVYAGGGIIDKSCPETEWRETEAKSAFLIGLLKK